MPSYIALLSLYHYCGSSALFRDMGLFTFSQIEMSDNNLHIYGVVRREPVNEAKVR